MGLGEKVDVFKNRKGWKAEREKPKRSDPSVVKARGEFLAAVDSGDYERVKVAVEKLKSAQLWQILRLR